MRARLSHGDISLKELNNMTPDVIKRLELLKAYKALTGNYPLGHPDHVFPVTPIPVQNQHGTLNMTLSLTECVIFCVSWVAVH
ncbi:MAG: hypothetical protein LBN01_01560 [Endomicrobium sp.]|jgi:hypothetical protein|nr:hypothetical protein [Endomicrobium sp.]